MLFLQRGSKAVFAFVRLILESFQLRTSVRWLRNRNGMFLFVHVLVKKRDLKYVITGYAQRRERERERERESLQSHWIGKHHSSAEVE